MNEVADKRSCRLWLAFAYALMSAWAGASVSLLIKFVKESGVDQILMTQWCVQYFLLLPVITYKRQISIKDNRTANILLFVRAAAGVSSSSVLYYSFKLISVGDATAIVSTYIALVGFLSCILLKEPCGASHIVLSLLALVGLVFVAQPTFLFGATQEASQDANRPLGILMACLGAVLGAVALISVRKMGAGVPFTLSMFYYVCAGICSSVVGMIIKPAYTLPCLHDIGVMTAISLIAFMQTVLLTLSLQNGPAGPVTVVMSTRVVFAFVLEFALLGRVPTIYSVIGASIVVVSSVGLTIITNRRRGASSKRPIEAQQ